MTKLENRVLREVANEIRNAKAEYAALGVKPIDNESYPSNAELAKSKGDFRLDKALEWVIALQEQE